MLGMRKMGNDTPGINRMSEIVDACSGAKGGG
jgi:hypothetical protein